MGVSIPRVHDFTIYVIDYKRGLVIQWSLYIKPLRWTLQYMLLIIRRVWLFSGVIRYKAHGLYNIGY